MPPLNSPPSSPDASSSAPTIPQAVLVWLLAALAMGVASGGMHVLATVVATRAGLDPATLANPKSSPLLNDPSWIALGTVANELAVLLIVVLCTLFFRTPIQRVCPLRWPSLATLAGALLVVFGLGPFAELAGLFVQRVLERDVTMADVVLAAARGPSGPEFALVLVCLALLPALIEELMFRGFITSAFSRRSAIAAVLFPSILFGLFHFEPTQVAGTMVLGIGFGLVRVMTGSLLPGIAAHFTYNAAVLIAVRYGTPEPDRPLQFLPLLVGGIVLTGGLSLLVRARHRVLATNQATAPAP